MFIYIMMVMKMKDKIKIISSVKRILQDHFGRLVREVILFGSRAYGNASEDCDYDIIIFIHRKLTAKEENWILVTFDLEFER